MMITIRNTKVIDAVLNIQFIVISVLILWLKDIEVNSLLIIQLFMGFWFYTIWLKGYRLRKIMLDVDLAVRTMVESEGSNISKDYIAWNRYLKNINKVPILFSLLFALVITVAYIYKLPTSLFKNIFLMLLFIDILLLGIGNFFAVQRYFKAVLELLNVSFVGDTRLSGLQIDSKYITRVIVEGILVGLIVALLICNIYENTILNCIIFLLAFSFLYSLSKLVIVVNKLVVEGVNTINNI